MKLGDNFVLAYRFLTCCSMLVSGVSDLIPNPNELQGIAPEV